MSVQPERRYQPIPQGVRLLLISLGWARRRQHCAVTAAVMGEQLRAALALANEARGVAS